MAQGATPAYYRENEHLSEGIGDVHDGTLTKEGTRWANATNPVGGATSLRVTFGASSEPWIYCASHYKLNQELRRLRHHFADEFGYTAAAGIRDANAFAIWLGINFALNLDRTTEVRLGAHDMIRYALTRYYTNPSLGSDQIPNVVLVYHGPVHYEDSWATSPRRKTGSTHTPARRAWFTKKMCFEAQSEYRFALSTLGDPPNRSTTSPCRQNYANSRLAM